MKPLLPLLLILALGLLEPALSPAAQQQQDADQKRSLPDGLKALKDPDPNVRYAACQLIIKLGSVAKFTAPTLREMLKDKDVRVRIKAAEALWHVEPPPPGVIVPVLVQTLKEKNPDLRVASLMVLGQLGSSARNAVPAIIEAVKDKNLGVRMEAVITLGETRAAAEAAVPVLMDLLKGEDVLLLEPLVTVTLGNIGAPAVPHLTKALADKDTRMRRVATAALGAIGPQASEAAPALKKALDDRDSVVRAQAARAVGRIGAEAKNAIPELRKALKDKEASVRLSSALSLWQLEGKEDIFPLLIGGLKEQDNFVREQALRALAEIGPPAKTAIPALLEALNDELTRIRALSAEALGKMPLPKNAMSLLTAKLKDEAPEVRVSAARALWKVQPEARKQALEILMAALKSNSASIRQRAAAALAETGPEAKAALSLLGQALGDDVLAVRQAAAAAMIRIDPATAARFGVRIPPR